MVNRRNNVLFRTLSSKLTLGVLALLFIWIGAGAIKEAYRARKSEEGLDKLKQQIIGLEAKNSELNQMIDLFKQEAFVEQEAKERLNLKNPGEKVIIIVDDKKESPTSTGETSDGEKKESSEGSTDSRSWWDRVF